MSDVLETLPSPLEELQAWRQALGTNLGPQSNIDRIAAAWPGLLLAHRFNGTLADPLEVLRSGSLILKRAVPKAGRAGIGTDQCVFASVGASPYWQPPLVLLFGPLGVIGDAPLLTPWDTRRAVTEGNHLGLDGAALLARYSFQGPLARDYLSTLLATCFKSLDAYVRCARPIQVDPPGVWTRLVHEDPPDNLAPLHCIEARFEAEVVLGEGSLRAVLVDEDALPEAMWTTRTALQRLVEDAGGHYLSMPRSAGAVDYRGAAADFILSWLEQEGWL